MSTAGPPQGANSAPRGAAKLHGDVGRREAVKAAALRFLPAGGHEGDEGDG